MELFYKDNSLIKSVLQISPEFPMQLIAFSAETLLSVLQDPQGMCEAGAAGRGGCPEEGLDGPGSPVVASPWGTAGVLASPPPPTASWSVSLQPQAPCSP